MMDMKGMIHRDACSRVGSDSIKTAPCISIPTSALAMELSEVERLRAARDGLRLEVAKKKRQERNLQRKMKTARCNGVLTQRQEAIALCLLLLEKGDSQCCKAFVASCGLSPQPGHEDLLVQRYVAMGDLEAYKVLDLDSPWDGDALQAAVEFRAQFTLAGWVTLQNAECRVAPPAHAIWQRYQSLCSHARVQTEPPAMSHKRIGQAWVQRWRFRWGGIYGSLPMGDPVSDEAIRRKVMLLAGAPQQSSTGK